MAIVQEMNLNMIPDSIPVIVRVDQYDTGVGRLVAHLFNGQNQYIPAEGATAIIQGTKPDNKGFAYNALINGSTVTADLETQMSCVGGNTRCQFVVTEPSGRTGTFAFVLKVQDSALADDTDISETDLPVYIDAAQNAAEEAEAAAATYPYINSDNYHWMVWDVENEQYVDTGVVAQGSGLTPGNGINIQEGVISVDADSEPTENSTKPVTSGGVYTSLQGKMDNLSPGANIQIENGVISATDTTYENATTEEAGLMSAADKTKLNGIEAGAQVNVQTDWDENDSSADDFLKNKPTLGTAAAKDSTSSVTDGSTDLVESGAVKSAIDTAVSSAYKAAGTKTCAELVSALLVKANQGNVYNMTDAGTTTADFVEGAGHPIRIGDNVGIVKVGSDYKFDLLSGFVDTSGFQTKAITSPVEGQSTVEGALSALSSNKQPKTLSSSITVDGTTQTTVEDALSAINTLAGNNKTAVGKAYSTDDVASTDLDDADYLPFYDSSASAKKKTLWSNIKSKLKTYFDTLYATITDVTSKFAASVSLLKDTTGWLGGNELEVSLTTKTENGVTWTVNSNKSVETSGSTNADSETIIGTARLKKGNYVVCGNTAGVSYCRIRVGTDTTPSTAIAWDDGESGAFTINEEQTVRVSFRYGNNKNLGGFTFYPMILTAEQHALNPAYRPHHESVEDWYWSENAKLGAHQWFDFSKVEATTNLVEGSTYDDFTVSGTGTYRGAVFDIDVIPNTDYRILTDAVVTSGKGYINISPYPSGSGFANSGEFASSKTVDFTFNSGNNSKIKIACFSTTATSDTGNIEYKNFLLALADDTNTECTPYDMTNRQLTEKVGVGTGTIEDVADVTQYAQWSFVQRIGNLAIFQYRFTVGASDISTADTVIADFGIGALKNDTIFQFCNRSDGSDQKLLAVNSQGKLVLVSGFTLETGKTYVGNGAYVIK